mmetsp:Transcript_6880/g.7127  ORF Transcript_6880/g.7127 Transcript_6880/m.7127 type:complete len:86 (-) Transcript_6880:131-388(-)
MKSLLPRLLECFLEDPVTDSIVEERGDLEDTLADILVEDEEVFDFVELMKVEVEVMFEVEVVFKSLLVEEILELEGISIFEMFVL